MRKLLAHVLCPLLSKILSNDSEGTLQGDGDGVSVPKCGKSLKKCICVPICMQTPGAEKGLGSLEVRRPTMFVTRGIDTRWHFSSAFRFCIFRGKWAFVVRQIPTAEIQWHFFSSAVRRVLSHGLRSPAFSSCSYLSQQLAAPPFLPFSFSTPYSWNCQYPWHASSSPFTFDW